LGVRDFTAPCPWPFLVFSELPISIISTSPYLRFLSEQLSRSEYGKRCLHYCSSLLPQSQCACPLLFRAVFHSMHIHTVETLGF
jgi:hypothetical protein